MGFTATKRNNWLDDLNVDGAYISLHTADPGSTGASEATGGSPAYARQPASWSPASVGSKASATVVFNVPAGAYSHFGLWSAVSGGTFSGGEALPAPETYGSQGTATVTVTANAT